MGSYLLGQIAAPGRDSVNAGQREKLGAATDSTRRAVRFMRKPLVTNAKTAQKNKRMRLFRRARDTKTSVIGREADAGIGDVAGMRANAAMTRSTDVAPPAPPSYGELDESDVFVCQKTNGETTLAAFARASSISTEVTLFVHRWHQVEPGLLSWTFPSLRAALDAVQRMKNAIGWCVVSGSGWDDLDCARERGAILVEQLA